MDATVDPHAIIRLEPVLVENGIDPLTYLRLYIEDKVPPIIAFDGDLFITKSDLHLWKHRLRLASFDRKAEVLGRGR